VAADRKNENQVASQPGRPKKFNRQLGWSRETWQEKKAN